MYTNSDSYEYNNDSQCTKIMVLDDDLDIATLVKMTLQRSGFKNVFVFTDPLSALKHFRINHMTYSLVISDIRMPIMNGFEFVRQLSRLKLHLMLMIMTYWL